ncbi:MAG: hypothetical protein IPF75_14700 [Bacteroidetes bacterium]|nr:hypothetical protein [Bacteroidota bacterium]
MSEIRGLAHGGLAYTHAVAHNNIEGLMDLGTLFSAEALVQMQQTMMAV